MRELTESEQRLIKLLESFEEVMSDRSFTRRLIFALDSATWLATSGVRIVKCEHVAATNQYLITMTKPEYKKYLDLCCKNMGFKVMLDGSVMTHDNIIVVHPR